jgi:hypothetical protein
LKTIYPDYEWLEWKFTQTSKNFWNDIENHKKYTEWLGNKLGYTEKEHWYNITYNIIAEHHGGGVLSKYHQSPIQFLKTIYPDYEWLEWKFGMASLGTWNDINNHKKYAEWLRNILGYTEPEQWYNISRSDFENNSGGGLLGVCYNSSPIKFVMDMYYPEYEWLEWKFTQTSKNFWNNVENHKKYAEWLSNELEYKRMEDWYKITRVSIINNCGGSLLGNYYNNSPIQFVKGVFPDYNWDEKKFCKNKTEIKLHEHLLQKYPTLITQFKQEWCKNIRHLPFDFCIPEYKIIIELDGRQHFQQVSNWLSPEEQFENDKYKEKCANDNNYSVIRLLQDDVINDSYDWIKDLCDAIEEIKNGDEIVNVYLCKNGEYDTF